MSSPLGVHPANRAIELTPRMWKSLFADIWRDSRVPAPELLYWRTTTELEVDFVVETGGRLLPIEVKAATNPGYSDTRALRAFREEYPERFVGGLLLHGGSETRWMSEHILAVPWWRVL